MLLVYFYVYLYAKQVKGWILLEKVIYSDNTNLINLEDMPSGSLQRFRVIVVLVISKIGLHRVAYETMKREQ